MATYTEHYDLVKPAETDIYDVTDFNENMDTIDGMMAATEQAMDSISEKIGTSAEGNTLFSLLEGGTKSGFTAIKSIQHIVKTLDNHKTESTLPLSKTVIPENCFVTMEWMHNSTSQAFPKMIYTLNANNIHLSHLNTSAETFILGFWVIEFM